MGFVQFGLDLELYCKKLANFDFKKWRAGTVGCPPADRPLAPWCAMADRTRAQTPCGDHAPATANQSVSPFWERQRARSLPLSHFALFSLSLAPHSLEQQQRQRLSSSTAAPFTAEFHHSHRTTRRFLAPRAPPPHAPRCRPARHVNRPEVRPNRAFSSSLELGRSARRHG